MKKFLKKAEGFTLVELIVVIAILGILAGVAVPAYTGYINKANDAADITVCDAVKTAVIAAYTEEGQNGPACIVVADGSVKVGAAEASAAELADDTTNGYTYKTNFETYYGKEVSTIALDNSKAVWTGGDWVLTD